MKGQFILVSSFWETEKYLLADIYSDKRYIIVGEEISKFQRLIIKILRKIHLDARINKLIKVPVKGIWKGDLKKVHWEKDTNYYVIFTAPFPISIHYLQKLRQEYSVKYILLLWDAWDDIEYSYFNREYESKLGFDYMLTFDPGDAEKYGFLFFDSYYSMIEPCEPLAKTEYDLYYIGANKGRAHEVLEICKLLRDKGASVKCRITGVTDEEQEHIDGVIYNQHLTYVEAIKEMKHCNCILDYNRGIQTGVTARYYEAVCYNKKLLTNNKNVIGLSFYDQDYIHVFERPEDIDWDWVKERVTVDYHYDGRFSPAHMVDTIIKLEQRKEGQVSVEEKTP